jgi:hypothetical protein
LVVVAIIIGSGAIFIYFSYGDVAEVFEELFGGLGLDSMTESESCDGSHDTGAKAVG